VRRPWLRAPGCRSNPGRFHVPHFGTRRISSSYTTSSSTRSVAPGRRVPARARPASDTGVLASGRHAQWVSGHRKPRSCCCHAEAAALHLDRQIGSAALKKARMLPVVQWMACGGRLGGARCAHAPHRRWRIGRSTRTSKPHPRRELQEDCAELAPDLGLGRLPEAGHVPDVVEIGEHLRPVGSLVPVGDEWRPIAHKPLRRCA
jgi:hypothetical protein